MTTEITGTVRATHIAPEASAPMESRERVEAVEGKGLRGDRYFRGQGTYSNSARDISREITLIEGETIDAVQRDYEIEITPGEHRRNLTTCGIALNHLVGERFHVGGAVCEGVELCAPCSYLERLLEREGVHDALVHRGGLRARIVQGGEIAVSDRVKTSSIGESGANESRSVDPTGQ